MDRDELIKKIQAIKATVKSNNFQMFICYMVNLQMLK
jgi:hypothetical protein